MALIELRDVRRVYDLGEIQVHALRTVTLDIARGEYIALVGPSGSGKSTLMNTLGCLDRPTHGSYLLDGNEIVSMNLWGFKPSIFDFLQSQFDTFLKAYGNESKSEFFIPAAVDFLLQNGQVKVKVLTTDESWFGITYRQDKIKAQQCIKKLIQKGVYPERLRS